MTRGLEAALPGASPCGVILGAARDARSAAYVSLLLVVSLGQKALT